MTNEELQSKTINWLRFPLIAMVVLAHTVTDDDTLREYVSLIDYKHLSGMDVSNLTRFLLSAVVPYVIVPCFFMFSGFLFFYKTKNVWNRNIYLGKIKSRIKTLLIPYLLWNIIPVALVALLAFMKFDGSLRSIMNELQEKGILKIFWNYYHEAFVSYPYNAPLWYVRDLIIVALCSPLVYYFVKYTKLLGTVILGILFFVGNARFPVVAFFFTFGAYFAVHGRNMIMELRKGRWIWLCSTVITLILSVYYTGSDKYIYPFILFNIFGCFVTINIASRLIERGYVTINRSSFLSRTGFFIYAAHGMILRTCIKLLNITFNSTGALILGVKFFLAPAVCVSVCVALYWIADKTVPKLLGILTGSR
ncbi:MAG: acyltransferase [Bacteroidales bacterium]|jgi:hypothetical protein|nr:acyltransferase [Bacteroidales bacterium]